MKVKKFVAPVGIGLLVGIMALVLTECGNPANMGFCIACFLRDIAGALGLHSAGVVQYVRPEIIGLVLGAFVMAIGKREFKATGGSSPMTRFFVAMFVMVGALMFLGCPLRMVIRIGGGDLNAVVGLVGFIAGILIGIVCLNKGFTLKRAYNQNTLEGAIFPVSMVVLLGLCLAVPALFKFSQEGPGSQFAPWAIAAGAGLIVGAFAQRTRLCMVGGIRDAVMFKDFKLISSFIAVIVAVLVGNLILGKFNPGFEGQPVAHTDGLWNFLGMTLLGWGSVLLGGCPFRQLILAGQGNSDSAITVMGYIAGAALCHNFGLASSAKGPTLNGQIAVVIGFVVLAIVSFMNLAKKGKE